MMADDTAARTPTSEARRVGVVGAGYVGLTTAACLSRLGHTVVCADVDLRKVAQLTAGHLPFLEPHLDEMVRDGRDEGRLSFVAGAAAAAKDADVVFLCVPTPGAPDGSVDLSMVEAAARQIAPALGPGTVVVTKSTVAVGSAAIVARALGRDDVAVVSNPEFLRQGAAVSDFLAPDRIVIGADDHEAAARVAALYESLEARVLVTDPASAEMIKYAANGFLAMKVSYVNVIATMCESVGADITAVVEGIGADPRIGHRSLQPGPGWGGSCLTKDSRALVKVAEDHGYDFSMMRAVISANADQQRRMVDKIASAVGRQPSDLSGVTVGALGLTFKAGTDDLRHSPALAIIADLLAAGADVRAFDPTTCGAVPESGGAALEQIELVDEALDVASGADVLAVLTEWPEFAAIDLGEVARRAGAGTTIVDTRGVLDPGEVRGAGLRYVGVGRP